MGGYSYYRRYNDGTKVTKREILTSIIIFVISMLLTMLLTSAVGNSIEESNQLYYKAVKIQDENEFNYSQRTNVGNALVYGTFSGKDLVSFPEINKKCIYLERTKEKYTMHTRLVKVGKAYVTEIYYSWDYAGSEDTRSKEISIYNNDFDTNKFALGNKVKTLNVDKSIFNPVGRYKKVSSGYVYENSSTRYYYNYIPVSFNGTMLVKLADGTIQPVNSKTISIEDSTIENLIVALQKKADFVKTVIWIVSILITGIGIFMFVRSYHDWLERN